MPANELQRSYYRAGHAHAGMFVTLGLVLQLLMATDGAAPRGGALASGVLWAAILMPAGFFLSVIGRDPERPNALRRLIPRRAGSLARRGMSCALADRLRGVR